MAGVVLGVILLFRTFTSVEVLVAFAGVVAAAGLGQRPEIGWSNPPGGACPARAKAARTSGSLALERAEAYVH